ncbi:hypothetical protein EOM39_00075 [Candidatus Gracilibacteria bacterium]|nr:hypothetical protein [Candidatus Gracilibacteria bacterium]
MSKKDKILNFLHKSLNNFLNINLLQIDKYISVFFIIIIGYFISNLFINLIVVIPLENDYIGVELYKYFLKTFLSIDTFTDRYGYGFHIIHSIILFPFLLLQYFFGNISFSGIGFDIIKSDYFLNQIILYSGKIVSLLGLILTLFYTNKITYFFTKNKILSYLPILMLLSSNEVLLNSTRFRVDGLLVGFLTGALFYAIIFLEDYKIKNLYLFIFFSIFAFIVKYQALMFIFWLYIIIFFYLIYIKKYNPLYKGLCFFILVFLLLNYNYNQLIQAMSQWIDSNSGLIKLTQEELINLTYGFSDWIVYIFNGIYKEFNILIFIIIFGLLNFLLLIDKIKFKYVIIILFPVIMNYYLFTYVNILNGRHLLLLLIILSIISTIGIYFLLFIFEKHNKTKLIITTLLLTIVLNYTYNIFNLYIYNNYYSNINEIIDKNSLIKKISNEKVMFFASCSMKIPYGLNYLLESKSYCYDGNNKIKIKGNFEVSHSKKIEYDFNSFYNILKEEKLVLIFAEDQLKFNDTKKDFTIIYSGDYKENHYLVLKNINKTFK